MEEDSKRRKSKKGDKIKAVTCDVLRREQNSMESQRKIIHHLETVQNTDKESDSDISDSELSAVEEHDDVVIHEIGSSASDEEVFELSETQYTVYTRSGRRAGSWKKIPFPKILYSTCIYAPVIASLNRSKLDLYYSQAILGDHEIFVILKGGVINF